MTEQAGTSARSFCGFSKIATFTSPPLCRMHHRQLDRAGVRPLRFAMSDVETKSERGKSADLRVVSSAQPTARAMHRARIRIIPISLATAAVAIGLGWAMWSTYMETPWTRDGTVRAIPSRWRLTPISSKSATGCNSSEAPRQASRPPRKGEAAGL
jgi:hypothetical protein